MRYHQRRKDLLTLRRFPSFFTTLTFLLLLHSLKSKVFFNEEGVRWRGRVVEFDGLFRQGYPPGDRRWEGPRSHLVVETNELKEILPLD